VRLWTLHPKYLDAQGLVALWREALLAREVLRGRTNGYRQHPQLKRFQSCTSPRTAINRYLALVYAEARSRGYAFDRSKLGRIGSSGQRISVPGRASTTGRCGVPSDQSVARLEYLGSVDPLSLL
jgi:hypothetical protein